MLPVNLLEEIELQFGKLQSFIGRNSEFLLQNPETLERCISPHTAERLQEYRSRLSWISEIITRGHLKVVFFGRTSSGKSSVINALLGDSVLPTGLGQTTSCFVEVKGSSRSDPCLLVPLPPQLSGDGLQHAEVELKCLGDLASALGDHHLKPDVSVSVLWPRQRCPILEDDIVLVDSPGVDVTSDDDAWIDQHCLDADLFVLVVNSESTLMMREKLFFKQVAEKIAKPNILVVLNRWDCASEEEEYLIHAAQDQHIQRIKEFLVTELKLPAAEVQQRIFFLSGKEVLMWKQSSMKKQASFSHDERFMEWRRFEAVILQNLRESANGQRYLPHVNASIQILNELIKLHESIANALHSYLVKKEQYSHEQTTSLQRLKQGMEEISEEYKTSLRELLKDVEKHAGNVFDEELEDINTAVTEFDATFYDDPVIRNIYKQQLNRYLQDTMALNIRNRLSKPICNAIEERQSKILEKISNLVPQDKRDLLDFTPRRMPFEIGYALCFDETFKLFQEDIEFKSTIAPKKLLALCWHVWLWIESKYRSIQPEDPSNVNLTYEILKERFRQTVERGVRAETSILCLAFAAFVCRSFGVRTGVSLVSVYGSLYLMERLMWTSSAKERALKRQFVDFAQDKLKDFRKIVSSSCRDQTQRELSTTLVLAFGAVEGIGLAMNESVEKCGHEIDELKGTLVWTTDLKDRAQDFKKGFESMKEQIVALQK